MSLDVELALYERANPFRSDVALRYSNYSAYARGDLVRLLDFRRPSPEARMTHKLLRRFVTAKGYPCAGARAVFNRESYRFGYYPDMEDPAILAGLARDLYAFIAELAAGREDFSSFVAAFGGSYQNELAFEKGLWSALDRLRALDAQYFPYVGGFSPDPASPEYAFSFGGSAFFVVGMHPRASRLARRFSTPLLVFNPHEQFRKLRADGTWQRFQLVVRAAEKKLQGSLNPNLSEFGTASEARQYSGKPADQQWQCPYRRS